MYNSDLYPKDFSYNADLNYSNSNYNQYTN